MQPRTQDARRRPHNHIAWVPRAPGGMEVLQAMAVVGVLAFLFLVLVPRQPIVCWFVTLGGLLAPMPASLCAWLGLEQCANIFRLEMDDVCAGAPPPGLLPLLRPP